VRVTVDRERAAAFGFSTVEVAQYIGIALRGTPLREYRNGDQQIPVWVRFAGAEQFRIEDMSALNLRRADGTTVPLLSVVDVRIEQAPSQIGRSNRQTTLAITANLAPDVEMDKAQEAIQKLQSTIELEPGYSIGLGQDFDFGADAGKQMMLNTVLAFGLIFILMAALFESLLQPLAILSGVVYSILGVGWLFWATGTTFSIMAFIGILVLMGVVVNNGIVLVEHINSHRRGGAHRDDALVAGCRERLRPILMTMGTTILGMLPLCFGTTGIGGDGPPYYPMARAIAGGLAFSTVVTLLFLPTVYASLDDIRDWMSRQIRRGGDREGARRAIPHDGGRRRRGRAVRDADHRRRPRADAAVGRGPVRGRMIRDAANGDGRATPGHRRLRVQLTRCSRFAPATHTAMAVPKLVRLKLTNTRAKRLLHQPRQCPVSSRRRSMSS